MQPPHPSEVQTVTDSQHTYEDLKDMTVAQLREVAAGIDHPAVTGYSQKHKHEVLQGICEALGIEMHEHHRVVGINKTKVKAEIRDWKGKRDAAMEAGDHEALKEARRHVRRLKRRIRRATV
jgi:hypothetical protein